MSCHRTRVRRAMDEDEDAALERFMQEDALLDAIQYAPDLPGTGPTVSLAQASRTAPPRSPAPARAPGIVSLARDHGAAGARGAEEHARNSAALATAYHEALRHGQSCAGAAASTAARGRGAAAAGGEDTSYAAALAPRQPLEVEAAGPSGPTPRRPAAKATGVPLQAVPLAVAALMGMWFFGPTSTKSQSATP
ncbi:unnamed protein product [Prorocentrum cordatum]|uniref:Uncharacterized protein n=1 Tax=Prorocentrum cordatum TaxID=2364126 RepID=A0ABN9R7U8_9DINO|nr:unnamed protein product [Polarella glacialis]